MALFVSIAILVSTINEIIGSKYGLIFGGKYHYDQTLTPGPMIYNIPLLIPIVWSGLIYMGYSYSLFLTDQIITVDSFISGIPLIIATGFLLVVLDMVLDPIAVDEKRWSWELPGAYYGIPLLNFFGWFLTVGIILSIFFSDVISFHVKLYEKSNVKIDFLKEQIQKLNLNNVSLYDNDYQSHKLSSDTLCSELLKNCMKYCVFHVKPLQDPIN